MSNYGQRILLRCGSQCYGSVISVWNLKLNFINVNTLTLFEPSRPRMCYMRLVALTVSVRYYDNSQSKTVMHLINYSRISKAMQILSFKLSVSVPCILTYILLSRHNHENNSHFRDLSIYRGGYKCTEVRVDRCAWNRFFENEHFSEWRPKNSLTIEVLRQNNIAWLSSTYTMKATTM